MAYILAAVVLACCCLSGTLAVSPQLQNYGDPDYDPIMGEDTVPAVFPPEERPANFPTLLDLHARVEKLEAECNGKMKVAFSASLSERDERTYFGPHDKNSIVVFKTVTTNIGNAYDSTTGLFSPPVRGVYYLRFTLNVGRTGSANAVLLRNGDVISSVYETAGLNNSGANGVTLLLEKGDRVIVAIYPGFSLYGSAKLSTFSGFLIFPM